MSTDGWERAFEMSAPQHDFTAAQYAVSACYESYHLFVAVLNPSRGRAVPSDIQGTARSQLTIVRANLRGAGAVRPTNDEAEKDLVRTLGNLGALLGPFINQLAGTPPTSQIAEVRNHPAVAAAERNLRDRILTAGGDPSRVDSRLLEAIKGFTGAAQLRDLNDRPALPGLRQSLPILMNLAITAATHPDAVTANQAQTALSRFAAMVSRLDAQTLVDRARSSSTGPLP